MQDAGRKLSSAVHHIGLTVGDLQRSIDFYVLLGAQLISQAADFHGPLADRILALSDAHFDSALLRMPAGDYLELLAFHHPVGTRLRFNPSDPAASHIGFLVDDIAETFRRLSASGVEFNSEPQEILEGPMQGMKFVYARDPDGAILELVERPSNGFDGMLGALPRR
jgi:catechol 2,3-dioxygenase-like lactoylglutathione lyase family enzyme